MAVPGFKRVDHVALTVPDLDEAVRFYVEVFGAEELYRLGPFDAAEIPRLEDGRDWTEAHVDVAGARLLIASLQLAENLRLELFEYQRPDDKRREPPRNCDAGATHIALEVSDLEAALAYLRERGLQVLAGPIVLDEGPAAGQRVQYVKDPFGNQLELIEYAEQR